MEEVQQIGYLKVNLEQHDLLSGPEREGQL
jgi:hypothetical protein